MHYQSSLLVFLLFLIPCAVVNAQELVLPKDFIMPADSTEARELARSQLKTSEFAETFGNFEMALPHTFAAYKIYQKFCGANSYEVSYAAQRIGYLLYSLGAHKRAIPWYEEALEINRATRGEIHTYTAEYYYNLGALHMEISQPQQALDYSKKGLDIYRKLEDEASIIDAMNNLGATYQMGFANFEEALAYHSEALERALVHYGANHQRLAEVYINLGIDNRHIGNFDASYAAFYKAFELMDKYPRQTPIANRIALFFNLSQNGLIANDLDGAIQWCKKAEEIVELNATTMPQIAFKVYNLLGNIYYLKGELESSEAYYKKVRNLESGPFEFAQAQNGLSLIEIERSNWESALAYQLKAAAMIRSSYPFQHSYNASIFQGLALCYARVSQWEESAIAIDSAYMVVNYRSDGDLAEVSDLTALLHNFLIHINVNLIHYEATKDVEYLKMIKSLYPPVKNIFRYQSSITNPTVKAGLAAYKHQIIELLLTSSYQYFQMTKSRDDFSECFELAEDAKAILLLEQMQNKYALAQLTDQDSLIRKEQAFRLELTALDRQRNTLLNNTEATPPDAVLTPLNYIISKRTQQYNDLIKAIEQKYPKYYKAKYTLSTIAMETVQKELLQPGQTLLQYLAGDSSIFILAVQQNHYSIHQVKRDFPLDDWINQMTEKGIYHPINFGGEEAITNYATTAHQLYQKLIKPVVEHLTDDLLIIPDGILGKIPFDALLSAPPSRLNRFNSYPFLIQDYQISYAYSATLQLEMQQKKHLQRPSDRLLAMAPFDAQTASALTFSNTTVLRSDTLAALPYGTEECREVTNLLGGQLILGEAATIDKFQSIAGNFSILHLSTHGKANNDIGDFSYLAFHSDEQANQFEKLFARDIYNYTLNADMVVLSACETGVGKLHDGEGIISLARAFAYAGAKSVFPTLWQVSDEKTKELITNFYKNLKKGLSKDKALHKAKIDYLNDNLGKGLNAHPFFWAGLIGIGDMQPLGK